MRLERKVHSQLQESRAAHCMLDETQASFRWNGRRPGEVGEEGDVVVRRVEIRVVEEIVGFDIQPQPETVAERESLP